MNAALQSLAGPEGAEPKPSSNPKPRSKRRSSYAGRNASTAAVHGRGSIGSVSAGLYKAFRERFLSSDDSGDYRKLRQRDAEIGVNASSPAESSGEEGEPSSSSSVEDIFASETERRKWRRKSSEQRRRAARRKVSGLPI
ncbi:hypothetical protein KR009_005911 [Drosophila setifemur]|nr:hypothetical protein KR009_005911 [Drosophila setifemur]